MKEKWKTVWNSLERRFISQKFIQSGSQNALQAAKNA